MIQSRCRAHRRTVDVASALATFYPALVSTSLMDFVIIHRKNTLYANDKRRGTVIVIIEYGRSSEQSPTLQ